MQALPYKISTLVYLRNRSGDLLLMQRAKAPNQGMWSPIGGKLDVEETGLPVAPADLHLFAMIAEKHYEDRCHWLMFLFDCRRPLEALPAPIDEGRFAFFPESAIDGLEIPETDRTALWPVYFNSRAGFTALRADCSTGRALRVEVDESMPDS